MPTCKIVMAHDLLSHEFKLIKQSLNLNFILFLYVLMERVKRIQFFHYVSKGFHIRSVSFNWNYSLACSEKYRIVLLNKYL